jgi:DNA repair exonuclease SbcCD ATPase subunit
MKTATIIQILLGLAVVILLVIIFGPCRKINDHSGEATQVQGQIDSVRQREIAANVKADSLKKEIEKAQTANAELQNKKQDAEERLSISEQKVNVLAWEVRHAKQDKDTVKYYASCDSLASVAVAQGEKIATYQHITDSIEANYTQQISAQGQMLSQREQLYGELRTSFDKVSSSYQSIYTDYSKNSKKLKRAKALNRILAVAVLVAGGIAVAK